MRTVHTAVTRALVATAVCVGVATCAAAAPYNPDHLPSAQLARIVDICHNVLGLERSERPSAGVWPGRVHLPHVVSRYQGCIVSLSDSLQQATPQPRAAKGRTNPIAAGSFLYASGSEIARREQQACEALGFMPPSGRLAACTRNLQATFFAIDHPIE